MSLLQQLEYLSCPSLGDFPEIALEAGVEQQSSQFLDGVFEQPAVVVGDDELGVSGDA